MPEIPTYLGVRVPGRVGEGGKEEDMDDSKGVWRLLTGAKCKTMKCNSLCPGICYVISSRLKEASASLFQHKAV